MLQSKTTYDQLEKLKRHYRNALLRHDILLTEHRDYQKFFKPSDGKLAESKAEDRYDSHMYNMLQVDAYGEGKFSLEHKTLNYRMAVNKQARKDVILTLAALKQAIRDQDKIHAQTKHGVTMLLKDLTAAIQLTIEELLQANGIEIVTIRTRKQENLSDNDWIFYVHVKTTTRHTMTIENRLSTPTLFNCQTAKGQKQFKEVVNLQQAIDIIKQEHV